MAGEPAFAAQFDLKIVSFTKVDRSPTNQNILKSYIRLNESCETGAVKTHLNSLLSFLGKNYKNNKKGTGIGNYKLRAKHTRHRLT